MGNPIDTQTTLEEAISQIREEIESSLSDIDEIRREQGPYYDQNCYGTGFDEGHLNGLRLALAILGGKE